MALGATRGRVSRMVATSAGWLVSVGFLLGAPTAFWSTRFAARSVENLPAGGAVPIASAAAALKPLPSLRTMMTGALLRRLVPYRSRHRPL